MVNAVESFKTAIQAHGLQPPDTIQPGKLHRFPGYDKGRGNDAAWCKLFDDLRGGVFGDFSTGLDEHWQAETERNTYTAEEREAFKQRLETERQQRQAEQLRQHEAVAKHASELLAAALSDPTQHPYAIKKAVDFGPSVKRGAWTQRGWIDVLLIPIYGDDGKIWTLEAININGEKDFLKGGRKRGGFHPMGKIRDASRVLIGEGLATVAAVHAVDGVPGVAAMDAGNLSAVALAVRSMAPDAELILLADNDIKADGSNPGLKAATEAAQLVGGRVAVPELDGRKCDFWDLWSERGADAVRDALPGTIREAVEAFIKSPLPLVAGSALGAAVDPLADGSDEATIKRLATLSPLEYDRQRKTESDRLGVRPGTLDKMVAAERKEDDSTGMEIDSVEPWPESVAPDQVLTEVAECIRRFIVCEPETAITAALWSAMTWFIDAVQVAPLAVITAPEKRCGKSQLLFLLGRLVNRPLTASNISPAALFRAIDAWQPTLLVDEADAFMKDNEELRGLINCGHTRDSAYIVRVVGENFTPTKFNVWGAKAISGIGHLADTLMDRAVVLELRRKLPHESVDRLRYAEPELFNTLAAKLARFADDYRHSVRTARPDLPEQLNDRAQDNWEPLLAIADVAGGHWPQLARSAALKLSGSESDAMSVGVELLADIQEIFDTKKIDRIFTADLIAALCEDDEKPWATYNRGKAIAPRQVSNRLTGYGIKSKDVRIGYEVKKGFSRDQFDESFHRYLHGSKNLLPESPILSATTLHSKPGEAFSVADAKSQVQQGNFMRDNATDSGQSIRAENVADKTQRCGNKNLYATLHATAGEGCSVVADRATKAAEMFLGEDKEVF